jgi:cytochrome oxidase assembly protein ShyY1
LSPDRRTGSATSHPDGPVNGPANGPVNGPANGPVSSRHHRGSPEEPEEALFRLPRPDPSTMRDSVRLLRRRGWALALLGVIGLSAVFVGLGRWQYHRHEAKVERRDVVRANYDAPPVPVAQVAGPSPLRPADQWRPVTATGVYESAARLFVRNRPLDTVAGFHELVPLRLPDGRLLMVDRGWIPAADSGARRPQVLPVAPSGTVTVTVRLRPFEPPTSRTAPRGQVSRIDHDQVARAVADAGQGGELLGGYGVLAAESPAPAAGPVLLPKPDVDLGVHLAYAYQWWFFAAALYLLLAVALYRETDRTKTRSGTAATQAGASDADKTRKDVTVRVEDPPSG